MIVKYEAHNDYLRTITEWDLRSGRAPTYNRALLVNGKFMVIRMTTATGWVLVTDSAVEEVVHEFHTNDPEVVVSILNLLYDTK